MSKFKYFQNVDQPVTSHRPLWPKNTFLDNLFNIHKLDTIPYLKNEWSYELTKDYKMGV